MAKGQRKGNKEARKRKKEEPGKTNVANRSMIGVPAIEEITIG